MSLSHIYLAGLITLAGISLSHAEEPAKTRLPLDSIVAVVNDEAITRSELEQRIYVIKKQMEEKTSLPPKAILERQILDRLIMAKIQLQLAAKTGIRVDDDSLNRALERIAEGNKLSLTEFRKTLERDGIDFAGFREDIRNDIILNRLRQRQVDDRIVVTESEIDTFLTNQKAAGESLEEYRIAHILIATPENAKPEQLEILDKKARSTLAELRNDADFRQTAMAVSDAPQALEGGDLGWRKSGELPSLFADAVIHMNIGAISDIIRSPSGYHIIKLVDKRLSKRHIETQTLARHILIKTSELVSDNDAKERLTKIRQRLQEGADFATLARANSDDKASASKGGSLDWISPGTMLPQFEDVMNSLKEGEISAAFKTRFGWHIVNVEQRRQQDETDKFVRNQARDSILERKTDEEYQLWLRQLRDEAYVENRLEEQAATP